MKQSRYLAALMCAAFVFDAQLRAQTPTPIPPVPVELLGTTVHGNGLLTTLIPGQQVIVQAEDGSFSVSIPLTKAAVRFLDRNGASIDPSRLAAGARLQAILDDNRSTPTISAILVDQN